MAAGVVAEPNAMSEARAELLDGCKEERLSFVSVVIAARNEEKNLGRCLSAILAQDYPKDRLEVVIADGMSTDGSRAVIAKFEGQNVAVRVVDNPGLGRAHGLNAAIRASRGEIIVRVDARTVIQPDYVRQSVATLLETGADNVGAPMRPAPSESAVQEAVGVVMSHPFGVGNSQFRLGERRGYVDTVYLGCYRRELFDRLGFFDEEAPIIGEEIDLNQRIIQNGGKVYLEPRLRAYYYPRDSIGGLGKIYYRYGGARAGTVLKNGALTSWRQAVAPAFVATLLLTALGAPLSRLCEWSFLFLIGAYLAADLAISCHIAVKRRNPRLFAPLLVAFPTMHFSWAAGFFVRILIPHKSSGFWPN